ncbi:SDR family NAD(P)-dependent oxidoreductase [Thermodesulfobacteriota bacterium]
MELKDRVAIITGGTGGLGQRICHLFIQHGVSIALGYLESKSKAEKIIVQIKRNNIEAIPVQVDITKENSVSRMVDYVMAHYGRIDILVNNAAYNKYIPFEDLSKMDITEWLKTISVNLNGPFLCTKAVTPFMKKNKCGRIINISSVSGLHPWGASIAYCVSKAGLIHLTKCLSVALAPEILVNSIAPGFMEGTRATSQIPKTRRKTVINNSLLKRAVSKDDVALAILEFCRNDSITGQTLVVDAGRIFH